jgi:hypothetical protein
VEFTRLTRDIYVPAGDVGFWQGTFRDPSTPEFAEASAAIAERRQVTIDVLYGDHEGGQRSLLGKGLDLLPGHAAVVGEADERAAEVEQASLGRDRQVVLAAVACALDNAPRRLARLVELAVPVLRRLEARARVRPLDVDDLRAGRNGYRKSALYAFSAGWPPRCA